MDIDVRAVSDVDQVCIWRPVKSGAGTIYPNLNLVTDKLWAEYTAAKQKFSASRSSWSDAWSVDLIKVGANLPAAPRSKYILGCILSLPLDTQNTVWLQYNTL